MGSAAKGTRVLVVDDERAIALTLAAILDLHGYVTCTAFSGTEALEKARSFRPDFLLSDVMMPGMNGIEAAERILSELPTCQVLLVSGQAATTDLLAAARAEGFAFEVLSKPVHPTDLLQRIRELLSSAPSRSATILNVDDYELHRYAITQLLANAGYIVKEATTGEQALKLAETRPDLIVLDVNLPDISGFEVCKRLKTSPATSHIPVIHLTGTCKDEASERAAYAVGAAAYITHPVEPEALFQLLEKLLSSKQ